MLKLGVIVRSLRNILRGVEKKRIDRQVKRSNSRNGTESLRTARGSNFY